MSNLQKMKTLRRTRKSRSVRSGVRGNAAKPRLSVFRSSKYIYVQAIDDETGVTVASASELEKDLKGKCAEGTKTDAAKVVGTAIGERLKAKGVARAVFDRGWYKYHGRIKALADAAREAGLEF